MNDTLSKLAADPNHALSLGKAAEHLVCADLLLSGHRAFLADQGLPYDVIVEVADRLYRVQVKSCAFPRDINAKGRAPIVGYRFDTRRCGKRGRKLRAPNECDLLAFVALDGRLVAYLPFVSCPQALFILAPGAVNGTVLSRGCRFDEFPFATAFQLLQSPEPWRSRRGRFISAFGKNLTIREWAAETGLPLQLIHKRIATGWNIERVLTSPIDETRRRKPNSNGASAEVNQRRSDAHKAWWDSRRAEAARAAPGDQLRGGRG